MSLNSLLTEFLEDPAPKRYVFSERQIHGANLDDLYRFHKRCRELVEEGILIREVSMESEVTLHKTGKRPMEQVKGASLSALEATDERSKAVQKTPWRVSLEGMKKQIESIEYIYPTSIPHMTIAVVVLKNGYALQGMSAPADPANFNEQLGKDYAYEDAMKKLWPLEAYVMRDYLTDKVSIKDPEERWNPVSDT